MSTACHLALQLSTVPCTFNQTFGCSSAPGNAHGPAAWVSHGCRAWLRCGEAGLVQCGDWRRGRKRSRCLCRLPTWEEMAWVRAQSSAAAQQARPATAQRITPRGLPQGPPHRPESSNTSAARTRRGTCSTLAKFKGQLPLSSAPLLPGARNTVESTLMMAGARAGPPAARRLGAQRVVGTMGLQLRRAADRQMPRAAAGPADAVRSARSHAALRRGAQGASRAGRQQGGCERVRARRRN